MDGQVILANTNLLIWKPLPQPLNQQQYILKYKEPDN